ncbi:hypothetical protein SteCoe_3755 [Stentor coeruleus]|uniref:Uncharacterized protein n=1 Tax=Stentor coeruleus TaxID=5963 RepID=A0A1R2CWB6_9CILI|nr:hypothetical protein SteCoe_3755 [Stentor coeruleus]
MSKNANLRKQIRDIISSDRVDLPKKRLIRMPSKQHTMSEDAIKTYDIRTLLQEDKRNSLEKLVQNPLTRDISHIQDKITPLQIPLPILPTDIQELQKFKKDLPSINTPNRHKRILTADSLPILKTHTDLIMVENMPKIILGNPTGRQDIKELCVWFNSMLEKHRESDTDTLTLIYEQCARELVRQVTVQCIERGELLQVLLNYQPELYKRKNDEIINEMRNLKVQNHKTVVDLRCKFKKNILDLEEKLKNNLKIFETLKQEKEKNIEEIKCLKQRCNDLVKKYLEDEKQWRNKHLSLLLNLKKNLKNEKKKSSTVAVASWNQSTLSSESNETSPSQNLHHFDVKTLINKEILELQSQYSNKPSDSEDYFIDIHEPSNEEVKFSNTTDDALREIKDLEAQSLISIENLEKAKNADEMLLKQADELLNIVEILKIPEDSDTSPEENSIKNDEKNEKAKENCMKNDLNMLKNLKNIETQTDYYDDNESVTSPLPIIVITEAEDPYKTETEQEKDKIQESNPEQKNQKSDLDICSTTSISIKPKPKIRIININKENDIEGNSEDSISDDSRRSSKMEEHKGEYENNEPKDAQSKITSQIIAMITPKTTTSTKKPKKKLQKFSFVAKKISKDITETKNLSKKEHELQEIINDLKNKLKEKTDKLAEFTSNTKNRSSSMTMEKLKVTSSNPFKIPAINASFLSIGRDSDNPNISNPNISQQIVYPGSLPDDSDFSEDFLIPQGCDYYSWKTGYCSGFERGRRDGIREGEILGIEENDFNQCADDKDDCSFSGDEDYENIDKSSTNRDSLSCVRNLTRAMSIRSILLKKKAKDLTKIIQFQFSKPVSNQKKHQPASTLLAAFFRKSREFILSKSTLSRKIVNKMIANIYMNCLGKIKNGDQIECLAEQVYDDFYQKYGLKAVSEKRFLEFVASVYTYVKHRRVQVFFKFLGCAGYVNMENYSRISFVYYLSSLQMMLNMKLGIMVVFDEIADKQMFPTIRGLECAKEKLERITDKATLNNIMQLIQNNSEADSKGINTGGLIELEFILELLVEQYEIYQKSIEDGLVQIFTAFNCDEYIGCYELLIAIRHISYDRLEYTDDEAKIESSKKVNFNQLFKELEGKEIISLHEVSNKCVENNLLRISQVTTFCPVIEGLNREMIIEEIQSRRGFCEDIARNIGMEGKKYKTLDGNLFMDKILNVAAQVDDKDPYHSLLAWRLYENELKRLDSEF